MNKTPFSEHMREYNKTINNNPADKFNISQEIASLKKAQEADTQETADKEFLISNDIKKQAKFVVEKITTKKGTYDEKQNHNETLAKCIMGDVLSQNTIKALIKSTVEKDLQLPHGEDTDKLIDYIYKNHYGLGPIEDLTKDASINEIMVNKWNEIWIERKGKKEKVENCHFKDNEDLMRVIRQLLQYDKQDISVQSPIKESRMLDGSRISIIIPPVSAHPQINIRKHDAFDVTTENYLSSNSLSKEMVETLNLLVKGRSNILIIGEVGSGKTTFLKWLVGFMSKNLRIGTIETDFELKLAEKYPNQNIFSFEEHNEIGISMQDLFNIMLRCNPDIIICGEGRSYEMNQLISCMRRGHPGSIGTAHSNSPETVVSDIVEMINEDGKNRNAVFLANRVASAIDIIIQTKRFEDGSKRISRITEIISNPNVSNEINYSLNDLYIFSHNKGEINKGNFVKVGSLSTSAKEKIKIHYPLSDTEEKLL